MPECQDRRRLEWIYSILQNPDLDPAQVLGILETAICASENPDTAIDNRLGQS
jgi:hypothetical protein